MIYNEVLTVTKLTNCVMMGSSTISTQTHHAAKVVSNSKLVTTWSVTQH